MICKGLLEGYVEENMLSTGARLILCLSGRDIVLLGGRAWRGEESSV